MHISKSRNFIMSSEKKYCVSAFKYKKINSFCRMNHSNKNVLFWVVCMLICQCCHGEMTHIHKPVYIIVAPLIWQQGKRLSLWQSDLNCRGHQAAIKLKMKHIFQTSQQRINSFMFLENKWHFLFIPIMTCNGTHLYRYLYVI